MDAVLERLLVGTASDPLDRPLHFILKPPGRLRTSLGVPSASGLVFSLRQSVEQDDGNGHPRGSLSMQHIGLRDRHGRVALKFVVTPVEFGGEGLVVERFPQVGRQALQQPLG
jgi:hypothetical protein